MLYGELAAALAEHGLIARGGLREAGHSIVMIGSAGSAFWPHFQASRRDEPDPLDQWSCRVITGLGRQFTARPLFPQAGPPFLPFQRWAMAADAVFQSPMGVLVHNDYGLWHSYRGALLFQHEVDVPPTDTRPNPCATCAGKPCAQGCPVGAAVPYDVPKCLANLRTGASCRSVGCLARHACPLGCGYAYSPDHAAFHMEAFVNAGWG